MPAMLGSLFSFCCSTPAPCCCPPPWCPPASGLELPLTPGGLQHQSIAQSNEFCFAMLVCSSSLVLFPVWFCPINFCTVQLPLLQTALLLLHSQKFSANALRLPCAPVPLGTASLSIPLAVQFAPHI